MTDPAASEISRQRQRSKQAWNARSGWDGVYQEAYDYVLPNRRPGGLSASKRAADYIFDMTGPNSAMHFAGELQRQAFPINTPFTAETGPLIRANLTPAETKAWDRNLDAVSRFVYPFFTTGEFDNAIYETCTDLGIGTGAILPLKGPSIDEPLIFVNVPQDEIAISQDAWNRVNYVSWRRTNAGRESLIEAWPKGHFSKEFRELAQSKPYDEVTVYQDFFRLPAGRWRFVAYLEKDGDSFIVSETYRTQPIAVARFYRWPGEAYGRGPILFALPTIKTANKAQELTLKAAAIQMLGIWGFRAGGTFNPDTVRVGPAEFWPMQSTGGVLGPDVQRLDPASGNLNVSRLVMSNLQSQIREALLDTRMFDDGGTPPSASEVAFMAQQNAKVHVGAYGRLNRELVVPVVRRAMEILNEWRILPQLMSFNELMVSISINSPMAQALKADELQASINYYKLAAEMAMGPPQIDQFVSRVRLLERARRTLLVPPDIEPTDEEMAASAQAAETETLAAVAGEAAVKAAPQLVQAAANENSAAA